MKKIAIFGCKATTKFILKALSKKIEIMHLITISPNVGVKHEVADYCDLDDFARSLSINVYQAKTYNLKVEGDIRAITEMKLDLAFVIGWQRLIPATILRTVSIGVFGMHGSSMNLPFGRGRSPMNWSLIEDRKFFYTNLFKYDAGVDSGDILDTFLFSITPHDTAETMHFKNMLAMKHLILRNAARLLKNDFTLTKQADETLTHYPKRNPSDSLINWERDIFYIERFIRAVTKPFNGAYTFAEDAKIIIYRASIFESDLVNFGYTNEPIASVVEVLPYGKFLVKCRGGLLLVHEYESPALIHPRMQFGNSDESVHHFEFNKFGYYDLNTSQADT